MPFPSFPEPDTPPQTKDSINMLLSAIAMEESGFSRILLAESEKLQYVLGNLDASPEQKASVEDILAVNQSVKDLLDSIMQNQAILKGKIECIFEALSESNVCVSKHCKTSSDNCAVSFHGVPEQRLSTGNALIWKKSACACCRSLQLCTDRKKILLEKCRHYAISFSATLSAKCHHQKQVSLSLQTSEHHQKKERFICHAHAPESDAPFTVSASGVYLSTQNCPSTLSLVLLSPSTVNIKQSSIYITELSPDDRF